MGFNATMVIMNDHLHEIRDDKEFGSKVYDAVSRVAIGIPVDISTDHCMRVATVIESHHADGYRVLMVGANEGVVLGYAGHWSKDPHKKEDLKTLMNNVLEEYGLKVVKKRKARL